MTRMSHPPGDPEFTSPVTVVPRPSRLVKRSAGKTELRPRQGSRHSDGGAIRPAAQDQMSARPSSSKRSLASMAWLMLVKMGRASLSGIIDSAFCGACSARLIMSRKA